MQGQKQNYGKIFNLKFKKKLGGLQTLPTGKCDESEEFFKKIKTTIFAWSNLTNDVNFNASGSLQ